MSAIEECRSFAALHGLAVSEKLTRLGEPIVAIAAVRSIVDSAVAAFLAEDIEAQPTIGMLHKMLSDILDQCEDMLVALSSCSPPTAEIIARATLERGVNLRYIIGQDRERRLLEYIGEYVSTSESMVSGLSKTFAEASPEERPYFEAVLAQ